MAGITCQEFTEWVTEYLEGAMLSAGRSQLDSHLSKCRHCRQHLKQMQLVIQMLGRLKPEPMAPDAKAQLVAVFRSWKYG